MSDKTSGSEVLAELEMEVKTEEKKPRIVHLVSPGLCESAGDPQHTANGKIQVLDLIATIVAIGFKAIVAGMGRRHDYVKREIVEALKTDGREVNQLWWNFLGSGEYEYLNGNKKERVFFPSSGSEEKENFAGLGDLPKELAWALIDQVGDEVLLVADHQLIKSLGRPDIARPGRLYRLNLDQKTVEMIG